MTLAYRKDIDGLRALAVVPVVLFHAKVPWFEGGFVGVDVFFVISGFLITSLVAREVNEGSFTYLHFWERRARRLLPPIIFVAAFCAIFAYFFLLPGETERVGQSLVALSLFASNVFFWLKSGYFEVPPDSVPLLHTWSLAVEEQYYLIFPAVLIFFGQRLSDKRIIAVAGLMLISFVISVWQVSNQPGAAYFLLPSRAWELLIGSVLALGIAGNERPTGVVAQVAVWLGLSMIAIAVFSYDEYTYFPGIAALLPCIGTAMLIWAGVQPHNPISRFLTNRAIVYVGTLSYAIYLWHWPLLSFWAVMYQESLTAMPVLHIIIVVVLSVIAAWFSLNFIENPIRRRKVLSGTPALYAFCGSSMLLLGSFGFAAHITKGFPNRVPEVVQKIADSGGWEDFQYECAKKTTDQVKKDDLCLLGKNHQVSPTDKDNAKFALWGDSHAQALIPAVDKAARELGISGFHASKGGCPPLIGVIARYSASARYCTEFNAAVLELIERDNIKTVIMVAYWNGYGLNDGIRKLWPVGDTKVEGTIDGFLQEQLWKTIARLTGNGVNVIIIEEPPFERDSRPRKTAHLVWRGADVNDFGTTLDSYRKRNQRFTDILDSLATTGLIRFQPTRYMCDSTGFCPGVVDGHAVFLDSNHMTRQSSIDLSSGIKQVLLEALQQQD